MDGNHGISLFFAKCAYHIISTFLHFGIGTLYGIQLNATAVTSGIYRRYGAAAQTDAVVVAADHHYFVSGFRGAFQTVALRTVTYTAGKHDYFVVTVNFFFLFMFESKHGTANQRLAEFVAEVTGTVGGLDQDLFRSLV